MIVIFHEQPEYNQHSVTQNDYLVIERLTIIN